MPPNKSPLRYPGGKTRACSALTEILEQHFDMTQYTTIASPFFGGGSFEFHLQGRFKKPLLVNDKFSPLYRFWKQVKDDGPALCATLRSILVKGVTKADFAKFRETIMSAGLSQLETAMLYFVINRCSFSGATLSGGFSEEASKKRFTESSVKRISELDMTNVSIANQDFADFLDIVHNDAFIFLDPPYYLETSNLYGNNGDMHESFDHQALFNAVTKKSDWMMTYNNCPYIRDLYKDYTIIETSWSYGMNASKESSEIVILCKKNI
jgi:DNA adenine methylase